ncbi:hypothetical protein [Herbidospora daliensis]|uniref:hypothetical protein n=1 Tax=Herbidospora daliensis TaxID=295585 RepID=UPI00078494C4|nr:hypothetical protein [Herbidospora daliensis]
MSTTSAEQAVRAPILNSWQRCQNAGLIPGAVRVRLLDDLDLDSILVRAAQPILDRLQIEIADTPSGVFLSDASGALTRRILGETAMQRTVDGLGVLPGFSYAEADIGTNAIGSALLERRTYLVAGSEHLWEEFQQFDAVGSPVRNPLTGRTEGVLCIAAMSERMNAQVKPMMRRAIEEVEQSLVDLSASRERALFTRFLNSRSPAVVPASVPSDLPLRDRLALEDAAVRLVAQGREAMVEIALTDGRTATVVAQVVAGPADLTGIAVQAWVS